MILTKAGVKKIFVMLQPTPWWACASLGFIWVLEVGWNRQSAEAPVCAFQAGLTRQHSKLLTPTEMESRAWDNTKHSQDDVDSFEIILTYFDSIADLFRAFLEETGELSLTDAAKNPTVSNTMPDFAARDSHLS